MSLSNVGQYRGRRNWAKQRFINKRERLAARRQAQPPQDPFQAVTDHENLIQISRRLKSEAGQAPGRDGVRYSDLSRTDSPRIMRELSRSLRDDAYRPLAARKVRILKSDGIEHRTLRLRGICDRIVSTAIKDYLSPKLEKVFLPCNYGFRPATSVLHMLADLEAAMATTNHHVLAIDDVRKAFDNVRIADVLGLLGPHINHPRLLALAEIVLRGHQPQPRKEVGIDQGDPLSPVAMNLLLHHVLDTAFCAAPNTPLWYRYVDNLTHLCQSAPEGHRMLTRTQELLHTAGLTLKGKDGGVTDLRTGTKVKLLGFDISLQNGQVVYQVASDAWGKLRSHLERAHEQANPPIAANGVVYGWLDSMGPAYPRSSGPSHVNQVRQIAAELGFREVGQPQDLLKQWMDAHGRWEKLRGAAYRRMGAQSAATGRAGMAMPPMALAGPGEAIPGMNQSDS